jgi:outer membrane protein assembly factor BamB
MSRAGALAIGLCLAAAAGCRPRAEVVRIHQQGSDAAREVVAVDFTQQITVPDNFVLRPDEHGGAAADPARDLVYVGSREGTLLALRADDGAVVWERAMGGAVSSVPALAAVPGQAGPPTILLVGTDNGTMHALDLDREDHDAAWRYETPGRITNAPLVHEGVAFFVNSRDQIYALDLRSGGWRWQYEQEFQTDFTVHGHAGLAFVPAAPEGGTEEAGTIYAGFDNGKVAAIGASSGQALWLSSVAPAEGGNFVDCDSTPLVDRERTRLYVTGQSTGVHALSIDDGSVLWRFPLRAAGSVVAGPDGALLVSSSLEGLHSLDHEGTTRWRAITDPGVLSDPVVVDGTVYVTHSEIGLLAYDYDSGELLGQLRTGSGMSSTPTYDPARSRIYAISNRGLLLAMRVGDAIAEPWAPPPGEQAVSEVVGSRVE